MCTVVYGWFLAKSYGQALIGMERGEGGIDLKSRPFFQARPTITSTTNHDARYVRKKIA